VKRYFPQRNVYVAFIAAVLVFGSVTPALGDDGITIDGGGWGHGIGMPQYGAKEMAETGSDAYEIVQYFYTGTTIRQVGTGSLVGHADPLRIGVAQNSQSIAFDAVGGPLTLCMSTDCSLVALPGDGLNWSIKSTGAGNCQFYNGSAPVGVAGPCQAQITWGNQPSVRVAVPSLGRTFARGKILAVSAPNGRFHLIVELGLEEYLYGLGEMPSSWHFEALKAQALAGRSYALYKAWVYRTLSSNQPRLDACGCHLYASTYDQKYIGWAKEAEGTNGSWGTVWRSAVDATAGEAITHSYSLGRSIQAYYHSSTGGATENNNDVWGGSSIPYLRSVSDPGPSEWTSNFAKTVFASALGFDFVTSAKITGTFESGSPSGVLIAGQKLGTPTTETLTGNQLRSMLGLKSHNIFSFSGFLPTFAHFVGGDFDGDGNDEVAALSTSAGSWWVFDADGATLDGAPWAGVSKGAWQKVFSGDFTGDGKTDVAMFSTSGGWWVGASTGSGFQFTKWGQFGSSSGWKTQRVGDYDGDGKDDIANFHPGNGTWWVSKSDGSRFSTGLWADFTTASGWGAQIAGDFDGDGKDDIANFHPGNGTWWVSRSNTSGFRTSLWADYTTASGWAPQVVGDFNDDGKADIANYHSSNGKWWVSRSSGSSFSTYLYDDVPGSGVLAGQVVGDFDGDGDSDVSNFLPSGEWHVS
jgi:SpoIID/LytB domain protein